MPARSRLAAMASSKASNIQGPGEPDVGFYALERVLERKHPESPRLLKKVLEDTQVLQVDGRRPPDAILLEIPHEFWVSDDHPRKYKALGRVPPMRIPATSTGRELKVLLPRRC